jgi:hypothetical protein
MNTNGKKLGRRAFLQRMGLAAPLVRTALTGSAALAAVPSEARPFASRVREMSASLVVLGGGLGGCSAALAAARNGLDVILTEETDWIGGQLTQQAVPPDENKWIETFGGTGSYQALRNGIRNYYKSHYPLTAKAKADPLLNPGNCWVSRIGSEPRVALSVLYQMLAPYLGNGRIRLLLRHKLLAASTRGDEVEAVRVRDLDTGHEVVLHGRFFADATEQGDLLPASKTEYVVGAESKAQTGEPHAKDHPQPDNLQGFTFCFALDYRPGEEHTIPRPEQYSRWRDVMMEAPAQKPYPLLSFEDAGSRKFGFDPQLRKGFWTYRRIADRDLFEPGFYEGDLSIINWPHNDYSFGRICDVTEGEAEKHRIAAKQLSLSLCYWLQTSAPRPDGGAGWKGLRLRPDIVGTSDGLAKYPYIREGRRLQAEFTVCEQHVTTSARMRETGLKKDFVRATPFADSVGIGSYHMDLHITTRGDHAEFGSTLPFQIPLGALIPRRVENLIAACKNPGVTHLTNGCYRLHPVEWNVGEAAGALAAFCSHHKKMPRQVRNDSRLLGEFQGLLTSDGVRLHWPAEAGAI